MTHPAYDHLPDVRPKPRLVTEDLPLFQHPADFAEPATKSDNAETLLEMAERCANAILDAQGTVTVGEVREQLGKLNLLANDGKERGLDALGALGRRMGLVAVSVERQTLMVTHGNRGTRWRRPETLSERKRVVNETTGDRP